MASGWNADSDSDKDDRESKLNFDDPDGELYTHLPKLVDGVTKQAISDSTQLVALYQYQASISEVDNRLLKNLTGITIPQGPCYVVGNGKDHFPPTMDPVEHGYHLMFGFNKLLLAPVVRLQCNFVRIIDPELRRCHIYHSAAVEWHFNDYKGAKTGITDYAHDDAHARITFSAGPATCSGFNKLVRFQTRLGAAEREVIDLLKSFLEPGTRNVTVQLKGATLSLPARNEMNKLRKRLSSGDGLLLPSLGQVEYAAFGDEEDRIYCDRTGMRKPADLLRGTVKHPMVPLDCTDTFSTVKEAVVQLACAAVASEAESRVALKLWSEVYHRARLFAVGNFAVLGVKFRDFQKLGSVNDDLHYRLPRELNAWISFKVPGSSKMMRFKAQLMGNFAGLPSHDAFFRLTSAPLEYFGVGEQAQIQRTANYFDVKIKPVYVSATHAAQLATIFDLQLSRNERWREILLNQAHDAIAEIDITQPKEPGAVIPANVKQRADDWLLRWMSWNAEQLQVVRGIKAAKGGVIIVMGPAGTGKTLLQQALGVYFYFLGFHVLALAPANSNVDHLAVQLAKLKGKEALQPGLKYNRLYPSLRDYAPSDDTDEQLTTGNSSRSRSKNIVHFYELLSALDERESDEGTAREHGVVQAVLRAAEQGDHKLTRRLRTDKGTPMGNVVNAWDLLREFLARYREGGMEREELLSHNNDVALERYRLAYKQCRAHIIGRNRFMLTTTGNARSSEMLENWYAAEKEWGVKRLGVIVFVDEAAKDLEVNVWSGIVCGKWSDGVKGIVMFGDDKQLQPTNTCSKGRVNFNAFNGRLDIPLPCRLVREGFPCFRLLEQRRMHATISAFPNREIYRGKLRDGNGTNETLDEKMPAFGCLLTTIIANYGIHQDAERAQYKEEASDTNARLHWIEVKGDRIRHPSTKSVSVAEHVAVFFGKILPYLQTYFKLAEKSLEENVMIICAYSYALHEYQDRINEILAKDKKLTVADMPRVLTVDASQGQESFMVIFDGSCQHGDVMGFMEDVGRCNVAITRAKEVFWMIGGSMRIKYGDRPLALLTKYKQELEVAGKCHRFN